MLKHTEDQVSSVLNNKTDTPEPPMGGYYRSTEDLRKLGLHYHHEAKQRGTCNPELRGWSVPYKGKFGIGLKRIIGNSYWSDYSRIEYWVY